MRKITTVVLLLFNSLSAQDGPCVVKTLVGRPTSAAGDGGAAGDAQLFLPRGVALDPEGNVYVAEVGNRRIRMITRDGLVTTFAGTGRPPSAAEAEDASPTATSIDPTGPIAFDSAGNLLVVRKAGFRISRIAPDGAISTAFGGSQAGPGSGDMFDAIAVDRFQNIFISHLTAGCVRRLGPDGILSATAGCSQPPGYGGDGGPATQARLSFPKGIAVDNEGNLYIADSGNQRIRRVSPDGIITTVVGPVEGRGPITDGSRALQVVVSAAHVATDSESRLFFSTAIGVWELLKDSTVRLRARLNYVSCLGVNTEDDLLACAEDRIWLIPRDNSVVAFAGRPTKGFGGDGGPGTEAMLNNPGGVAVDSSGALLVADELNHSVRRVTFDGIITTAAGRGPGQPGASGDDGPATNALLRLPRDVAADSAGSIYIADTGNNLVRKVSADGVITTLAGSGKCCSFVEAPAAQEGLAGPSTIAVDGAGVVYIGESGRIRKVSPDGILRMHAGVPSSFLQIALDAAGNLYAVTTSRSIQKILPSGPPEILTFKDLVSAIAFDFRGNLYYADASSRIHRVTPAGQDVVLSGATYASSEGEDGVAYEGVTSGAVRSMAVDRDGNLYFSDVARHRIRTITQAAYCQPD